MQGDPKRRARVAVRPQASLHARPRLFATLEATFPVAFAATHAGGAEATIVFGGETLDAERPTLVFGSGDTRAPTPSRAQLADGGRLDSRVRGLSVIDPLDEPELGSVDGDTEVLASSDSRPVWTRARSSPSGYRVSSSLPELESAQTLRDLLAERPLAAIALIEFLREVSAADAYEPPPLRAAILFDDPNLRWRTYGFIDYAQLLDHADAHGYHASMAMIPLDGGRQHRATVKLFRGRPDRLSLAFHGNDHLDRELVRVASDSGAVAIVAQALRRVARLESRYGLHIDRVMTAPHGMCSATVAHALGPLGFDALCAIHPLPWRERPPADRPLAGWEPAEFSAGCAVIPRLPLTADAEELALRAYLDQPLILYGHHEDLADGLDLLAEKVAQVNGLGAVRWSSLGEIATSNHATSLRDGVLHVRPYAHRLRLPVQEGVESVLVERPRRLDGNFVGWTVGGEVLPFDAPARVPPEPLEIRLAPAAAVDPAAIPSPRPSAWPLLRRAATETRDRLRPLVRASAP